MLVSSKVRLRLIFLLTFWCVCTVPWTVAAQNTPFRFDRLTIENGLSHNDILAIIEDTVGFMWFGTADGLNRYDGAHVRTYRHDESDSNSLLMDRITGLCKDRLGNIWVVAGILHRYDPLHDIFERYWIKGLPESESTSYRILCDSSNYLWIATRTGVARFDPEHKTYRPVRIPGVSAQASYIIDDGKQNIWLSYITLPGCLFRVNKDDFNVHAYRHDPSKKFSLPPFENHGLTISFDGTIQVEAGGQLYDFFWQEDSCVISSSWKNWPVPTTVWSMGIKEDQQMWILTSNAGVYIYKEVGAIPVKLYNDSSDPHTINSDWVRCVFYDRIGNLWCGTTNGIAIMPRWRKNFIVRSHQSYDTTSLRRGEITSTIFTKDGTLWLSVMNEGLVKYDVPTDQITNLYDARISRYIFGLFEYHTKDELLWSTTGQGMIRYNIFTKAIQKSWIESSNKLTKRNLLVSYVESPDGTQWFGTDQGLLRIKPDKQRTWYEVNDSNMIVRIRKLYIDQSGKIWISRSIKGGLICFDPSKDTFITSKTVAAVVTSIAEDSKGNLWIGTTNQGFGRYEPKTDSVEYKTIEDGLSSNETYGILADRRDQIWILTSRGITRYSTATGKLLNYNTLDGIPSPAIARTAYSNAYCAGKNGCFVFGLGLNGFVMFHPDSILINDLPPKIVITDFRLILSKDGKLKDSFSDIVSLKSLTIPFDQNFFRFEFAALDYTAPRKNMYQHKLEGFDIDWINSGNQNDATYTNVPPGEYVFRVKGSNNDGVWNEEGASIRVIITPPWWKTWWAYSVYGFLFVGLLYGVRQYELNRQRLKHEAEIEHIEAEKLREMDQMKSRFFANISHEFRTPLTLIEGPARRILSEEGSPKENAHLIVRNSSRLLQLVNQLLDLSKIEAGQLKLRVEQTNLCDLVKGIGAAFETMARKKDIRYKIEVPEREEYGWVDGDAVEKCITNLLSNAMKFTPECGSVTLAMESDGVRMTVRVTDSGIGIDESNMQKVFDRFYQVDTKGTHEFEGSGIGLALTKELVELHHGTIGIESTPGVGSTFTMSIPVNKESYTPEQLFEPVTDKKAEPKARKEDIEALDVEDVRSGEDAREGKDEQDGQELPLILLIEDNEDMRKYIRMHLNGSYKIVEASDGVEGLGKALETIPDIIISDQMMPKMEGSVLVQKVKSNQRISHIPVILLTAKAEQKDKLEGLGVGADDYLVKPFDAAELKARIDNLILQRRKLWDKFRTEWMTKPREAHAVSSDEKFLAQVMDIIEKNMSDPEFDLNRLADESHMSRVQLHRKLKALTGLAPGEFIRNYRLDRAAQLLKKKAGNVSAIAFDVGFNNLSYFAKAFREKFGVNPSDF